MVDDLASEMPRCSAADAWAAEIFVTFLKRKSADRGRVRALCDRREVGRRGLSDDQGSLHKDRDGDRGEQHEGGDGGKQLGHFVFLRVCLFRLILRCRGRADGCSVVNLFSAQQHKQKRGPIGPRLRSICAQALSDNLRRLQERHGGDRREQNKSGDEAYKLGHLNFPHVFRCV
jgi:hypothetical protein